MAKTLQIDIVDASTSPVGRHCLSVTHAITVSEALLQTPFAWQGRGIGVYGRLVKPDTLLTQDSRIEIYQPLLVDPKQARHARAKRHKKADTSPLP